MSGGADIPSVAGGWLGTYYYDDRTRMPVRFEATLRLEGEAGRGGRFGGTILDDGDLGEASVHKGVQDGLVVRFTKVYEHANVWQGVVPVRYQGTLSEDGKRMTGNWQLSELHGGVGRRVRIGGTWEARRIWSAEFEEVEIGEPEVAAVGRELATAGSH
ncbi:MAG TPA: hypothetical protein VM490_06965 [Armatimonadaceae bacterium]|nr:hypothetical protein [Armatimonadaceae bacterium]